MEQGKRVVVNSAVNLIARPLDGVIAFFLTPFVLHQIGKGGYGIWALSGSLLAYAGLLRFGLNSAVNLRVPKLLHAGDMPGINRVVSTAFAFYLAAAAVAATLVLVLTLRFPDWFGIAADQRLVSQWVVALSGGALVMSLPMHVFSGVLTGAQRFDLTEGPRLLIQLARALAIVLAFGFGMGLVALATISAAALLLTNLTIVVLGYRVCPGLKLSTASVTPALLPGMIAYSTSSFLFLCGQIVQLQAGKTIAGLTLDTAAVTEFTMPFTLILMVGSVITSGTRAIKPAVSLLEAQQREDRIRLAFLLSMKAALLIALPAAALFLLHGRNLLGAWIGDEYVGRGALLLQVMAVPAMLHAAHTAGFFVLAGLGLHRVFGITVLVKSIVFAVAAWVLASRTELGLLGIAVAYAVPELIASAWLIPRYCCGAIGLTLRDEWRSSLWPAVRGCLPLFIYLVLTTRLPLDGRWPTAAMVVGAAVPWALGVWFWALGSEERKRFRGYLPSAMKRTSSDRG